VARGELPRAAARWRVLWQARAPVPQASVAQAVLKGIKWRGEAKSAGSRGAAARGESECVSACCYGALRERAHAVVIGVMAALARAYPCALLRQFFEER